VAKGYTDTIPRSYPLNLPNKQGTTMPQQKSNDWSKWATEKLTELASKENRPIDAMFLNRISERVAVELIIESRGEKTSYMIESILFKEDENMRRELEKRLKAIVKSIKPNR
jgi:hypothetical protein